MRLAAALASALVLACIGASSASAAGMVTHAFMAERAIPQLESKQLARLLRSNRQSFAGGAVYPDSGYAAASVPGGDYGEVSHWEGFVNAYVARLRAVGCGSREAAARRPCSPKVAHLMGAAAHGLGDEMWDWLFEPLMADHGERPEHPLTQLPGIQQLFGATPLSAVNSPEYAMDMIAIASHGRVLPLALRPPPVRELIPVYRSIGNAAVTREGVLAGHAIVVAAALGERIGAIVDAPRVRSQMPWSSAHFVSESGGVRDTATGIAGYLDSLWRKLTGPAGQHPEPRVVSVHPEPGETGVPVSWQPVQAGAGLGGGGGGERRVLAVLSNSIDPASVSGATFRLLDPGGDPVPLAPGFPSVGPWGADEGKHSMLVYPAGDLEPCGRYTAVVTPGVRDHAGASLPADHAWSFRTRSASGAPCPP